MSPLGGARQRGTIDTGWKQEAGGIGTEMAGDHAGPRAQASESLDLESNPQPVTPGKTRHLVCLPPSPPPAPSKGDEDAVGGTPAPGRGPDCRRMRKRLEGEQREKENNKCNKNKITIIIITADYEASNTPSVAALSALEILTHLSLTTHEVGIIIFFLILIITDEETEKLNEVNKASQPVCVPGREKRV